MESDTKYERAKKRVEEIRGFRIHLGVYLIINALILIAIAIQSASQGEALFRWASLSTPFFWGIGLGFHAAHVFGFNFIFGKQWEERQIRKIMDKDRKEAEKFK